MLIIELNYNYYLNNKTRIKTNLKESNVISVFSKATTAHV